MIFMNKKTSMLPASAVRNNKVILFLAACATSNSSAFTLLELQLLAAQAARSLVLSATANRNSSQATLQSAV